MSLATMYECRSKRCIDKNIVRYRSPEDIAANRRMYCTACGSKMKCLSAWGRLADDKRQGALIDNGKGELVRIFPGVSNKASDTFTCTPDIEGCPVLKESLAQNKYLVHIPFDMYNAWVWLAMRFSTEWLAYLKGALDEATGIWTLSEMYFPKQKVNCAHVDVEDGEVEEGTIGSVHSHVGMGAFFSMEDKTHFNHPVEMVVNRRGDLAISVRRTLDCGRFSRIECDAQFLGGPSLEGLRDSLAAKLSDDKAIVVVGDPKTETKVETKTETKTETQGEREWRERREQGGMGFVT